MTTLSASVPTDRTATPTASGSEPGRTTPTAPTISKRAVWGGRVLTGLATVFLVFDAGVKVAMWPEAVASTQELGWSVGLVRGLGVLELVCLAIYLVPRTAVLGAVLWTGYLGGAIATHLRLDNPLFSHTLFPVYIAALIWGGLWLRDRRVRALLAR